MKGKCWFCRESFEDELPHAGWKELGYVICKKCIIEKETEHNNPRADISPCIKIYKTINQRLLDAFGDEDFTELKKIMPDFTFNCSEFNFSPKGMSGFYGLRKGVPTIELAGIKINEEEIINTLIHEYVHWILDKIEGYLTSLQLDNIDNATIQSSLSKANKNES